MSSTADLTSLAEHDDEVVSTLSTRGKHNKAKLNAPKNLPHNTNRVTPRQVALLSVAAMLIKD